MRNRRFLLLAAVLVALNTALWLVPQGLAVRQVVVSTLFGRNMVRADVVVLKGCPAACAEWRIARGVVFSNSLGVLKLREADTKTETIAVSSATRVTQATSSGSIQLKLSSIKPGWRVLVTWPAPNGSADSVVVERRPTSG